MSVKVVALGGGHGLAATLSSLRAVTDQITAIVTVADNGGSSGRLREEFNSLPPGDLRMALAALCGDDDWGRNWADILQYRFTSSGEMSGHAVGNLLLTALWDRDGDPVAGVAKVGELLRIVGKVLPMATDPLDIEGTFISSDVEKIVRGQVEVATTRGKVKSLKLIPDNPRATPQALEAIAQADWITIGPGSWFSSVMPHFLLKEQADAIAQSSAKKVMIFNLPEAVSEGEFAGIGPSEHLEFVLAHAPNLKIDIALADPEIVKSPESRQKLEDLVAKCGGRLEIVDLSIKPGASAHDVGKMSSFFAHIFP